ncbi:MAG: VCBS repeat-containing protein [Verrucomicrobia bacterium]|nr:VCBS repeat-containing protein [Verrucomicrobiota bacterium]
MNGVSLVQAGFLEPSSIGDSRYSIVASADFNGDELEDLLFQHSDGSLAVWLMDHTRLSESAVLIPEKPENANWRALAAADFSGDGKPDLALQHSNGPIEIWVMDGIRRVRQASLSERGTDPNWKIVGAADFNSDGEPDLIFQHSGGDLAVWYLDNFVARGTLLNPANSGDPALRVVSVADRNQDGKPDLLFQHSNLELAVWFMDGTSRTAVGALSPRNPGGTWRVVAPK